MFLNRPLPTRHSYESFTIAVDTLLLNYCFSKPIDVLKHNTTQRKRGLYWVFFLSVVQSVRQSMEFLIATPLKGLNKAIK